jgi:hypothetical protein
MYRRVESDNQIVGINHLPLSFSLKGFGWPDDDDIFTIHQPPEILV